MIVIASTGESAMPGGRAMPIGNLEEGNPGNGGGGGAGAKLGAGGGGGGGGGGGNEVLVIDEPIIKKYTQKKIQGTMRSCIQATKSNKLRNKNRLLKKKQKNKWHYVWYAILLYITSRIIFILKCIT